MNYSFLSHPLTGIVASIAAYEIGLWIKAKTGSTLANPLLVGTILVIALLQTTGIPLEYFRKGGAMITMLIVPATTILAIHINREWDSLRKNLIPVVGGCVVGSVVSIASIWVLCGAFGIRERFTASLLPKSVTTAISIELSEKAGGIPALTVSAVIITGIACAMLAPLMITLFKLKNPVAAGVGLGVAGHAVGTSKALELGGTEGAFSGIALGLSGIVTSVMYACVL